MKRVYSLYEAKARLSEIIREVRERGVSVTVSYHGKPVAEIRPFAPATASEDRIDERMRDLEASGQLTPGNGERLVLRPIAKRAGALKRFLEERD